DDVHLDFSGTDHDDITETTAPGDAPLNPASTYRPAWYAPAGSTLASDQGAPAAKAFCNGVKFDPLAPPPPSMARVVADLSGDAIDWNGDNVTNSANPLQDVNFDAGLATTFQGFDDWAHLRLDQIGAGQRIARFEDGATGGIFTADTGGIFTADTGGIFTADTGGIFTADTGGIFTADTGGIFTADTGGIFTADTGGIFTADTGGIFTADTGGIFTADTGGAARQELDFDSAKASSRSRPFALTACIVGAPSCIAVPPSDPQYHGRSIGWRGPTFGHVG